MNQKTRNELHKMELVLEDMKDRLEELQELEEEKRDNMPEGLQDTEQWYAMDSAAQELEEAVDLLGDAMAAIGEAAQQ